MAKDTKVTKTKSKKTPSETKETDNADPQTKRRYFKPLIRMVGNLHQNTSMSA
jgi:hypothetical protein